MNDLYPFRSMLKSGIVVSGGSDAPTEPISPLIGFWAATNRPEAGLEQRLTTEEVVRIYTVNAAYNGRDRAETGLKEGMTGDLTILDSNIRGIHPAMMRRVGIAATIVGGRIVYSYEGLAS
jgi:hypothetical protein